MPEDGVVLVSAFASTFKTSKCCCFLLIKPSLGAKMPIRPEPMTYQSRWERHLNTHKGLDPSHDASFINPWNVSKCTQSHKPSLFWVSRCHLKPHTENCSAAAVRRRKWGGRTLSSCTLDAKAVWLLCISSCCSCQNHSSESYPHHCGCNWG